jgi:hypothetical protein
MRGLKNGHPHHTANGTALLPPNRRTSSPTCRRSRRSRTASRGHSIRLREDYVGMPGIDRFEGSEQYYATLFHELVHATGHETRLNRSTLTEQAGFGSDPVLQGGTDCRDRGRISVRPRGDCRADDRQFGGVCRRMAQTDEGRQETDRPGGGPGAAGGGLRSWQDIRGSRGSA